MQRRVEGPRISCWPGPGPGPTIMGLINYFTLSNVKATNLTESGLPQTHAREDEYEDRCQGAEEVDHDANVGDLDREHQRGHEPGRGDPVPPRPLLGRRVLRDEHVLDDGGERLAAAEQQDRVGRVGLGRHRDQGDHHAKGEIEALLLKEERLCDPWSTDYME